MFYVRPPKSIPFSFQVQRGEERGSTSVHSFGQLITFSAMQLSLEEVLKAVDMTGFELEVQNPGKKEGLGKEDDSGKMRIYG